MRRKTYTPNATTAIALLALFLALGVAKRLKGNAGSNGAQGSQGAAGSQGPPGLQGPQGAQGIPGKEGPPGPVDTSALTAVEGAAAVLPKKNEKGVESKEEGIEGAFAACPPGSHAVSGGSNIYAGKAGAITGQISALSANHEAWIVVAANGGEEMGKVQAFAYCAGTGKAVTARAMDIRRSRVRAEERALLVEAAQRWKADAKG